MEYTQQVGIHKDAVFFPFDAFIVIHKLSKRTMIDDVDREKNNVVKVNNIIMEIRFAVT